VRAGAGRIDLYIRLGLLNVVVELKMCGGGSYSTTYALEGYEQLEHYMDAKRCNIGMLLVFDGRKRDFAKDIPRLKPMGAKTVYSVVVDVRPSVKPAR
jgi:hypothetical protein